MKASMSPIGTKRTLVESHSMSALIDAMSAFEPKRTLVEWRAVGGTAARMIVSVAKWPLPPQQLVLYLPIVFFSKVHTDKERQYSP
jgi:hypothetical protein